VALSEENIALFIPADSVLTAVTDAENALGFVKVEWDGKQVRMFAVDLQERGELIVEPPPMAGELIETPSANGPGHPIISARYGRSPARSEGRPKHTGPLEDDIVLCE
jgi:hypothetical protein